ncbi:anthranilate synthase component I [Enterococcus sp. LJL98]
MRKMKQLNGDCLTPVSAFLRIRGENKCLLESIPREKETSRYSIIAYDPVLELQYQGENLIVTNKKTQEKQSYPVTDPLKEVERYVLKEGTKLEALPFQGGAIGYIGYDIVASYEDIGALPYDELNLPVLDLLLFERFVLFDHQKENVTLVLENTYSQCSEAELSSQLDLLERELLTPTPEEQAPLKRENLEFTSNFTQETFEKVVREAKACIEKGELLQVVPSQRLKGKLEQNPFDYYRQLRLSNPSAYLYYLDFNEETKIIGASPESLLQVKGDKVTTNPIAGTRKRGATKAEDQALAEELLNDPKERAEHLMLIDLGKEDLAKISEANSVRVPMYMAIEKYRYVMHIVSLVEGRLKKGLTAMDALKATLPAGTVSGSPKNAAMRRIYQWEPVRRGVYAGAVGYFSQDNQADFAIGIRTLVLKNQMAYVQAGAGIVAASDPTTEYFETLQKAKALLEVER